MHILTLEEENLIDLLQQKDTDAFEAFCHKYAPSIYGLLVSNFTDTDKCSLLLQKIFLQFYKELNYSTAFPNGLFVYLYRIAMRIASENKETQLSFYNKLFR